MDREGKRVYRKIISTSGSSNVKERDLFVGENSVQRGWRSKREYAAIVGLLCRNGKQSRSLSNYLCPRFRGERGCAMNARNGRSNGVALEDVRKGR